MNHKSVVRRGPVDCFSLKSKKWHRIAMGRILKLERNYSQFETGCMLTKHSLTDVRYTKIYYTELNSISF
jgi:hypothetical protein